MKETVRLYVENAYWMNSGMPREIQSGHIWKIFSSIYSNLFDPKLAHIQKVNTGSIIDIDSITDQEWYEVGRQAVEDVLVEFRDSGIGILGRNNGLVICQKDGTPSDIIRLPIEDALKIGMKHIVNCRNKTNE